MIKDERVDANAIMSALEIMAANGLPKRETIEHFDIGTREYLSHFEREIIDDLVSQGGATCRFFEGAYGSGKTHMLNMLAALSLKRGMIVAQTDLSQALSLENWRIITLYILENMQAIIEGEVVRSLPEILMAFGKTGRADVTALKNANLPQSGFRKAMIYAVQGATLESQTWEKLRQFLLGRRVRISELRRMGLIGIKGPLSERNAELVIKTVLHGVFLLGFPGTMLLFDENEKTLVSARNIPSKKILLSANLMRRLIDGCTTGLMVGTVAVFAVLPGFLENCSMIYQALHQRLMLIRDPDKSAWRWPVIPIDMTNTVDSPESFLEEAISMLIHWVKICRGDIKGLAPHMRSAGRGVLERNVGSGYKRELMKTLALLALNRI